MQSVPKVVSSRQITVIRSQMKSDSPFALHVPLCLKMIGGEMSGMNCKGRKKINSYRLLAKHVHLYTDLIPGLEVESLAVFNFTPRAVISALLSDTLSFQIPRTRLSTVGSCAFSVFGPSTWNDRPFLSRKEINPLLRSNLKTFLFL